MSAGEPLALDSLPGEALRNRYCFINGARQRFRITDAIFPIFKHLPEGSLELAGTGFFICDNGVFVTAKHVLKDAYDEDGKQVHGLTLMQIRTNGLMPKNYVLRPIVGFSSHDEADIAVGVPASATDQVTGEPITNSILALSMDPLETGDKVITFAYPNTKVECGESGHNVYCEPAFYEGQVEAFWPKGQGGKLRGNFYQTNITIHGGASGGPVFGPSGNVCAINSSSFAGAPDLSFVTRINEILFLEVRDVLLPESPTPTSVLLLKLARRGYVIFDKPILRLDLGNLICDVDPDGNLKVSESP